jgi:Transcriptional Coactivator p15 (PC4)
MIVFEIRFGGNLWRVESSNFNGNARVSIWPYYAHHDGSMKPGRGGLQVPVEQVDAFIEAIAEAAQRLR